MQAEFAIDIEWLGFELHPETPVGGMPLTRLFPGRSIAAMHERMSHFAAEFGVDMVFPDRLSNTRRALAMSEYARDQGRLAAFRDAATHGYWARSMDLEDESDLSQIAEEAGVDPALALAASADPSYLQRVARIREQGIEHMVSGVPTLFVGDMPIVGCQRYETFERVLDRAGVARRGAE